ncbi:T6SS immunity protein Tli4 family protein [Pseudomonas alliivorans]|uniref:T6SS immunity protein Tli4 family protein n=1 Tax=Pseudomonas alliivorans TaxID=2810613 RepID=UPI0020914633|nr:T6SS immunity protein Tli4 family protein [Pseudomonas alliivorans]MCO5367823.1 T6SS immunity protein Tli4 family protein [Pseudomonas alliivorans]MEE4734717.1 T6SS immunity protein Tli4 family protein [Pseudomonas alliivorans]MEE4959331.1 T6SS immunity protein Tli4 family protein [Pseudomonas alliivorans]MEE4969126.1 T6SS immunity protein Tli4 family protein [Pseudomonas alliivorans]MEE4989887.1 T6SS immunity protein Tli4 family protein [Pseudomonas alliivorans]
MLTTQRKKNYLFTAFGFTVIFLLMFMLSNNEKPKKILATKNPKTHSVAIARYSVEIPESMKLTDIALNKDGIPIKVYFDYIKPRAEQLIDSSLATIKNNEAGRKTIEKPAEISQPSDNVWLAAYNHIRLTGVDVYGKPMDEVSNSSLGFVWKKNVLLEIGGERTLGDPSRIALLMSRFDTSDDKHSGFCFVKGCIEGKENERESLSASFEDTDKKGFNIGFNIDAYQGEPNLPLSDRTPSIPDLALPGVLKWLSDSENRIKKFKDSSRVINNFKGEEIIEGTTQKLNGTYLTEITGMWYYPGMPEDIQKPEIRITATYSFTSDHLPDNAPSFPNRSQDGLTEEEFLSAWNNLLESFHPNKL